MSVSILYTAPAQFIADYREKLTRKFLSQCAAECLGTLILTEVVGCIVANPSATSSGNAPIGIGWTLVILIFTFGHVSGGHLNPAVTLALRIRQAIDDFRAISYIISQLIGGLIGASIAALLADTAVGIKPQVGYSTTQAVSAEIFFTFLLCTTVINVASCKANAGNSFFAIAIGMSVTASAYAVGEISGGAFNPAVATGIAIVGGNGGTLWIYWIGEIVGAIFAGIIFYIINFEEAYEEYQQSKGNGFIPENQETSKEEVEIIGTNGHSEIYEEDLGKQNDNEITKAQVPLS